MDTSRSASKKGFILFLVTRKAKDNPLLEVDSHVIVNSLDRNFAASKARQIIGGNSDTYVVTPITAILAIS